MTTQLIARFQRKIDLCTASIEKFKTKLDEDPAHALSWGTDAFQNAAELRVLKQVVHCLQDGATKESIQSFLMDRVLYRSRYPAHSTSPTSNLIDQYELAACAELLSDLKL